MSPTQVLGITTNNTPMGLAVVPIPYPNTASMAMAQLNSPPKLYVAGVPAFLLNMKIELSLGDQAGSQGGVISGKVGGVAEPQQGSAKMSVGGHPVTEERGPFSQNGGNTVGCLLAPCQTTVILA
ncbi:DUF4150 domain-containing protein [Caballeronia zhejiangensis]|uniref:DUF4150 domain-containing protein n=1 Tax=Caballeronia zhejiangensis TaxID=871203 RepID=UPI003C7E1F50